MNAEHSATDFFEQIRRLEKEIQEINATLEKKVRHTAELESKNKELEQLTYVASHDLQEPVRTLSSFIDLLSKQYKGKLDDHADRYIDYIAQSSNRMKDFIKSQLDFSRLGKPEKIDPISCNYLLQQVLDDLANIIHENNAVIQADDLPYITGYRGKLKQVFQNLICNAIRFRKKEVAPVIVIQAIRRNECWQFTVSDNGIGIEGAYLNRIFSPYQRLHSKLEYEGSGMGLAICKKVVETHGGEIWATSVAGEGSSFHFTIPDQLQEGMETIKKYDFFISHATEDKNDFVRSLADALMKAGVKVWYDEHQLKVGDSLRKKIDHGLKNSTYGIVVLSLNFFRKNWPEYELNGLLAKEMNEGKVILPIWHKVTKDEVLSYSPSIADKLALNTTSYSLQDIVRELKTLLE